MQIKIAHALYIDETPGKGRGVFTREELPPMKVIETSSVLVMDAAARTLLDQTTLHDYIFVWGADEASVVLHGDMYQCTIIVMRLIASTLWILKGMLSLSKP